MVIDDSLEELGTRLEAAELEVEVNDTIDDVESVDAEVDGDVRLARMLEDVADDTVSLASDDEMLDPVVRLASRLDAEADDELGAAPVQSISQDAREIYHQAHLFRNSVNYSL
ncbi:MAG: hypothetical protein Q9178_006661 [Gyalolechia marmorata]